MTWDEFEAYVAAEIKKQGSDGNIRVSQIEVIQPTAEGFNAPSVAAAYGPLVVHQ
jgi:hypothetical protein